MDFNLGIIVDGEWGGKWRIQVKDGKLTHEPVKNLDNVVATLHFRNVSDFVLTAFQRFPGGEASGDPRVIEQFRRLFFRI